VWLDRRAEVWRMHPAQHSESICRGEENNKRLSILTFLNYRKLEEFICVG